MKKTDITNRIEFDNNEDEYLPITKCICGNTFNGWDFMISIYTRDPYKCSKCGSKLYFENKITVYKIEGE